MVEIILEGVTKIFGRNVYAVRDLSLSIRDKEFVVLLGPSGCGKTTTLYMIAGIYRPTRGNIYFDGVLMNEVDPRDRNVGMVFQSYALYPHMSVYDNIAFPLKIKKLPTGEIRRRVLEVAEMLRIRELLDRKPSQLSGGQQQRVALARAIVKEPRVFLMDEPLSNLDAKTRVEIRAELKNLQRRLGITTIYVTHDQAEAMSLADRIAVMNAGVLQQYDTPENIYRNPKNIFVASFIGNPPANLLDVTIDSEGNLVIGGARIEVGEGLGRTLRSIAARNREAVLFIRPEDVEVVASGGHIDGRVFGVEYQGREAVLHIEIPGGGVIRAISPPDGASVGARVWVRFNLEKIHLYSRGGEILI
ncbi:MAG: ABC transporter ATP-binding protein [Sulfolobales archaeon]